MPRFPVFTRVARFAACLATLAAVCLPPCAAADQINRHDQLLEELSQRPGANILAADCAAHAAFVIPTSPAYARVEFLANALQDPEADVESWSGPFDQGKQRITVDTVVTVTGLGMRKDPAALQPDLLHIRCGYEQNKLLAFSFETLSPLPMAAATPAKAGSSTRRGGRRAALRGHAPRSQASHSGRTTGKAQPSSKNKKHR